MSKLLYRIGKAAYGKPWAFIAAWILIIGVVVAMLVANGMSVSSEMKIEGTESQKVLDKLEKELPEASGGQASVLFTAPQGERLDTPERIAKIAETVNKVYGLDYIINPAELAAAAGADLSAGQAAQGEAAAGAGSAAGAAGAGDASTGGQASRGDASAQAGAAGTGGQASRGDASAQAGAAGTGGQASQGDASAQAGAAGTGGQASRGDASAQADAAGTGGQASQGDASAQAGAAQGADNGSATAGGAAGAGNAAQGAESGAPMELPPYMPLMIDGMPVPGVLIATDGSIALFQFQFTVQQNSLPSGVTDTVVEAVTESVEGSGIAALPSDSLKAVEVPIGINEVFGLLIAAVVLVMTLGSLVAAGLPIITALFGVGIGVGGAFALSTFVTMTSFTPVLALMIGLAVGIDYALFIVNRQRRLIFDQGLTAREAAGRAVGTAGSAVFFAGLTVIIALCGLLVIGISFLSMMALVASVTVLLSVLIALTLLPALLGLIGERICSAKAREKLRSKAAAKEHGIADAWVKGVVKFRWPVILAVIVLLGAAAIPAAKMELGIPSGASANLDTSARQSYDAISAGFGEGFNGPLLIVAEPNDSAGVIAPETLGGIVQEIQKHENVSVVSPVGMNADGNIAILSLIPKTGPTDAETRDLVQELREDDSAIARDFGVTLGVTGFTAINIDMSSRLGEVFPTYIGVIVILSLIILLLVFRSILVPIKATVGFLLSVLATFGITTAVFQWGWASNLFGVDTGGPLMSFIPILVTGILYGLAMDYQVFLVSSMRESYVHGHRGRSSVIHGYDQASRVVVAAAVIMVAVFAGFVLTHDIMIKQIGFALALGILIDAFFVRMALVPAVMALFGDKAWWLPKWLDRLLPNLDVEGDKLIAELQTQEGGAKSH